MKSIVFTLFVLTQLASADITLRFWKNNSCGGAKQECSQPGEDFGFCCTSEKPFCSTGDCVGCRNGNDIYGFNRAACGGGALTACREPGCCISLGDSNTCALIMEIGAGSQQLPSGNFTFTNRDGEQTKCKGVRYPHKMTFSDETGEEHVIFMPLGTMERANELVMADDWEQLKKEFPKYSKSHGQQHDYTQLDAEFKARQEAEEQEERQKTADKS
ncbi:hypothetical protein BT63DRAFT_455819 [Microthyrium microscopicum]|uniref:Uncharacterized protein n=1 Tax=Microthyrium microscopicum TaxID=703497 RepID=A0A6A6U9S0_9PEZI|nr:hypothetical protein BT63DRAFT_455819 [Microthyrium microscopicum]